MEEVKLLPNSKMRSKRLSILLALFILFFLSSSVLASKLSYRETPIVKVVQKNADAVVNISTERIVFLREIPSWGEYGNEFDLFFKQFFNSYAPFRTLKLKSVGSGVIVDRKGLIVTNAHVVNMATTLFVILKDGKSVEGKVVYEDANEDLAIIKIDPPEPLKEVKLGRTDDLLIGETVVAIGNPLGLENSVTAGIISGRNRTIYSSSGEVVFNDLLQTDAPINPGNSGGALLNLDGELIGINVAVVQNSQSIGFAIPVEKVKKVLERYRNNQNLILRQKRNISSYPKQTLPKFLPSPFYKEKWDPFYEMERIHKKMNQMLREIFEQNWKEEMGMFNTSIFYEPNLHLERRKDEYIIKLDIKDMDKNKINVEINEHSLTISGERSQRVSERKEGRYGWKSYASHSYNFFSRTIPLPPDADTKGVKTEIKGDVLIIRIPKK